MCSCAIICGGALKAALQHHTVLHMSVGGKKHTHIRGATSCHLVTNKNSCTPDVVSLESTCPKKKVADFFYPQASNRESLPPIKAINPADCIYIKKQLSSVESQNIPTYQPFASHHLLKYQQETRRIYLHLFSFKIDSMYTYSM